MSGKRMLAHNVTEMLGNSVHLSQTDPVVADLKDTTPESLQALLRKIRGELRCGRKVVFSANLASPEQRQRVIDVAKEVGSPRLLVELEGTDPAALVRASEFASTFVELRELLQDLREVLQEYRSLTPREHTTLTTLTVPAEQPTQEQVQQVLAGWDRLGAID